MQVAKRFTRNISSAFSIIAMIVVWLALAPTQAGGLASYIIVIGNSMEPKFHIGDLVIAHEQASYQVGDEVVYRNMELENFVFHRIISEDTGRYVLQGDNNDWVDTYQPVPEEVIGKLWLHVPRGGLAIRKIRNPFVLALVGAFIAALGAVAAATSAVSWFLAQLYVASGYALIGLWLIIITISGGDALSLPHRVVSMGWFAGVVMALGLAALPGVLRRTETEQAAPWLIRNIGRAGNLGWLLLFPMWCLWLGISKF